MSWKLLWKCWTFHCKHKRPTLWSSSRGSGIEKNVTFLIVGLFHIFPYYIHLLGGDIFDVIRNWKTAKTPQVVHAFMDLSGSVGIVPLCHVYNWDISLRHVIGSFTVNSI